MQQRLVGFIIVFSLVAAAMGLGGNTVHIQAQEDVTSPVDLVSQESLLAYLEDLTAIQAYSGWRSAASVGEQEAMDYITTMLSEMDFLTDLGLTFERQDYHVLIGTEIWESRLFLTVDGQEIEIPADAMRGPRENLEIAKRFDSDGEFNDSDRDPVEGKGETVLVRSEVDVMRVSSQNVSDKVLIVDYAIVDRSVLDFQAALRNAWLLVEANPAGIVLVTQFSNQAGESHGAFVADVSSFNWVEAAAKPPILYARLEDMAPAGIATWDDLAGIGAARLIWDVDIFSPGTSGNLIAHIPGEDSSQAVILGGHIDSPNNPGASDDGSGSVALMEVARVLNEARIQPPTDVYLVWFGSEELGLYGSAHFALTHQELLDRTLGMFNVDCLGYPLDGIEAVLELNTWSFGRVGDGRILWPEYLHGKATELGIETKPSDNYYLESDSTSFAGFGVPHVNIIYANDRVMQSLGGVHYASHLHDPYDTVELAREVADVLEHMAQMAVIAALDTGRDLPPLRVAPEAAGRVVFVASQTESVHMTPVIYTELGMTLLMHGLDVDLIPYGEAVTAADLENAAMVIVLPPVDYPTAESDLEQYDVMWTAADADVFEEYVTAGGMLVLANSATMLDFRNRTATDNEDWADLNVIAQRFGVTFEEGRVPDSGFAPQNDSLFEGLTGLSLFENNGVPFSITGGEVLVTAGSENVIARVPYGERGGEVLVLADVGLLSLTIELQPINLRFWENLAAYAASR